MCIEDSVVWFKRLVIIILLIYFGIVFYLYFNLLKIEFC